MKNQRFPQQVFTYFFALSYTLLNGCREDAKKNISLSGSTSIVNKAVWSSPQEFAKKILKQTHNTKQTEILVSCETSLNYPPRNLSVALENDDEISIEANFELLVAVFAVRFDSNVVSPSYFEAILTRFDFHEARKFIVIHDESGNVVPVVTPRYYQDGEIVDVFASILPHSPSVVEADGVGVAVFSITAFVQKDYFQQMLSVNIECMDGALHDLLPLKGYASGAGTQPEVRFVPNDHVEIVKLNGIHFD